jgi:hypothetical protein
MKKIFLIVLATLFYLSANSENPAQKPARPTPGSFKPAEETRSELEKRAKNPNFYIQHGKNPNWFVGSVFNFYDQPIFFDRDASGKPILKKISEHAADNPKFGKILLVIYYPNKKYKKQFVILGTYADPAARKKLLRKMQTLFGYARARAIWFPEQNAFILSAIDIEIDSTGHSIDLSLDPEIGKKFEKWLFLL